MTRKLREKLNCPVFSAGVIIWCWVGLAAVSRGNEPDTSALFENHVARILVSKCVNCHNPSEANGGLDLTSQVGIAAGGDSGATITAGQPDESLLLERVGDGSMPADGAALSAAEIDHLRQWVALGAHWPPERQLSAFEFTTERRAGYDWWSLQPVARTEPPTIDNAWAQTPIDRFILAKLQQHHLAPSPEADRRSLIRRVTLDLLGLPPTPQEVEAFVQDESPDAYVRLVDQLLASPRYGERWARHWLDVVRFGETNGYETNTPRPNAWHFRDYVISAFNDDKPYDQFIREQLAGDQLGALTGTGFLVGGAHDTVGNQTEEGTRQQRADDLDDMISATAGAFLGLTVSCARCHDHKFDPIAQRDYYGLQALLAGVKHGERTIRGADYDERLQTEPEIRQQLATIARDISLFEPLARTSVDHATPLRPSVHARWNSDRFEPVVARFVRFTILATNQFEPCLDELEIFTAEETPRNVALGSKATASSVFGDGNSPIHQLAHVNDGVYGNSRSWISAEPGAGWVQIELAEPATIDRVVWARDREERFDDRLPTSYRIELALEPDAWQLVASSDDRASFEPSASARMHVDPTSLPAVEAQQLQGLLDQQTALQARLPAAGMIQVYAGQFDDTPAATQLLYRGDVMQPRDAVAPATILALGRQQTLPSEATDAERRKALADWIAHPDNPLTARVLVNRIWHYHFGRGLVDTPNDFGFHGGRPSHPELLDWLASQFVADGWSIKSLHRAILLSSAYRQASRFDEDRAQVDADSRLLWRFPPRRLEAEAIRDSILAVSGKLDLKMGGPGYDAFQPNKNYVHVYLPKTEFGPEDWRRMVYQFKPRMEQDSTFGAFDCPDASGSVGRRHTSTTALQALNLLNSPFVVEQAGYFAERLTSESDSSPAQQVRHAFWLALGRAPDEAEQKAAENLIRAHGATAFCRALFNANEFLYLE